MNTSPASTPLHDELKQHWTTLGQDDFGCGLPGYYSANIPVTCIGRDIYLAARTICEKSATLKPDMDAAALERMRKALKNDVLEGLLKNYGPLIWANEERRKYGLAEEFFGSEDDSTTLLWRDEDDRLM